MDFFGHHYDKVLDKGIPESTNTLSMSLEKRMKKKKEKKKEKKEK